MTPSHAIGLGLLLLFALISLLYAHTSQPSPLYKLLNSRSTSGTSSNAPTLTRSHAPTMQSQTQSSTCTALSPIDFDRLAVEWGTSPAKVLSASSDSISRFGCAVNDNSYIRSIFLLAKDVTERDALAGFDKAKLLLSPVPPAPTLGTSPYLSFFLKSSNVIAVYFRQRIDRLLEDGDIETRPLDFQAELDAFIAAHPEWSNTTTSYISLLANPRLHRSMISRVQITGLCFLHAPLVALHYSINLASSELNNATVDITTALRHNFDDGILGSYLFADKGWWTRTIIDRVFEPEHGAPVPRVQDFTISFPYSVAQSKHDFGGLRSMLIENGVGIITAIDVDIAMWNASATSFSGSHLTKYIGGHSMVLIGVRLDDKSGQYYLLLQNWWESLQILEIRQDYASVNHAQLCFVQTPQRAYRKNWRTVAFRSANSAAESAGVELPQQS
jgi:hypothetical protein